MTITNFHWPIIVSVEARRKFHRILKRFLQGSTEIIKKKSKNFDFLEIQWLRLCVSTGGGGAHSVSDQGRSHTPRGRKREEAPNRNPPLSSILQKPWNPKPPVSIFIYWRVNSGQASEHWRPDSLNLRRLQRQDTSAETLSTFSLPALCSYLCLNWDCLKVLITDISMLLFTG